MFQVKIEWEVYSKYPSYKNWLYLKKSYHIVNTLMKNVKI